MLDPDALCSFGPASVAVYWRGRVLHAERDASGSITERGAAELVETGAADYAADRLFHNVTLSIALFGFAGAAELDGVSNILSEYTNGKGIEMGCGYGRLLLPLVERGFKIDGVDESTPALTWLRRRLNDRFQTIRSNLEEFGAPESYDFALSGMNSFRYLSNEMGLRRHLRNMAYTVKPGGVYVICVTLVPQLNCFYRNAWQFTYQQRRCEVLWSGIGFDRRKRTIIDLVEITDLEAREIIYSERQEQAHLNIARLEAIIAVVGGYWEIERCVTTSFCKVLPNATLFGNYWIVLRRKKVEFADASEAGFLSKSAGAK